MTLSPNLAAVRSTVTARVNEIRTHVHLRHELAEATKTLNRLRACANRAVQDHVNARCEADVWHRKADRLARDCAGLERTVTDLTARVCELEAQLDARDCGRAADRDGVA